MLRLEKDENEVDVDFLRRVFREIQYSCVESDDNWRPEQRFWIFQKLHHTREVGGFVIQRNVMTSILKPPSLLSTVKKSFCLVYTMYQLTTMWETSWSGLTHEDPCNTIEFFAIRQGWRLIVTRHANKPRIVCRRFTKQPDKNVVYLFPL